MVTGLAGLVTVFTYSARSYQTCIRQHHDDGPEHTRRAGSDLGTIYKLVVKMTVFSVCESYSLGVFDNLASAEGDGLQQIKQTMVKKYSDK